MVKTAAERQRERRQRLKQDQRKYERYKRQDRERKKNVKAGMTPAELQNLRKRGRLAVRKHRAKGEDIQEDRETIAQQTDATYRTPASLGKARSRVLKALPKSPRKRMAIVKRLACEILDAHVVMTPRNKLPPETVETVITFYENDSVSRMMPGKADYVTVRDDDNKKKRMQKRHMIMTLGETYHSFKEENPDCEIGKSKFAMLRPKWVLLSSEMPHNVCGCKYHSNVILLLEALHKKYPDVVPLYSKANFTDQCVCDASDERCMANNCEICCDGQLFKEKFKNKVQEDLIFKWYQWVQDGDNYLMRMEIDGSTYQAFDDLSGQLPKFFWHSFVKDKQARSYQTMKSASTEEDSETCLLQMDFSENYTCTWQDEIQSAHWRQRQVTVYTVMIYHRLQILSYVIVSDYLEHEKRAVAAFTTHILGMITDTLPTVKSVQIWSDGPSSQYKNRYVFALTSKLQVQHNLNIQWHYFATSHGKGPNDGIGGNAKRIVHRMVMARTAVVNSAAGFAAALHSSGSNINIILMSEEEIIAKCQDLEVGTLWDGLKPFKGTINTHCVKPNEDGTLTLKFYTSASTSVTGRMQYVRDAGPSGDAADITPPPHIATPTECMVVAERNTDAVNRNDELEPSCQPAETNLGHSQPRKRRKVSSKAIKTQAESPPCPHCNWRYGDGNDPKGAEEWICCQMCKTWFHETCAEENGIIDDDERFTCYHCL